MVRCLWTGLTYFSEWADNAGDLSFDSVNGLGSEHLSDGRNRICIGTACTVRSDIPVIPVIMYMYQLLKAEVAAEIPFATAE